LIGEIYKQYSIPINLQEHMLRVAVIGDIICEHMDKKSNVDRDLVLKTLLLHDMGNILKYDFSRTDLLADEDKKRVKELEKTQEDFVRKYGLDTNEVTLKIMRELGVEQEVIDLCGNSHGEHSDQFVDGNDWERKIAYYADMRIGPFGVKKIKDRFDDLIKRNSKEKDNLEKYKERCLKIEKQLQAVVDMNLQDIDDVTVQQRADKLLEFIFSCGEDDKDH